MWDPARFAGAEHFATEADRLIQSIRETPRQAGVDRIQLPGDRSSEIRARRLAEGIPVAEAIWEQLTRVAGKLRVEIPEGKSKMEDGIDASLRDASGSPP